MAAPSFHVPDSSAMEIELKTILDEPTFLSIVYFEHVCGTDKQTNNLQYRLVVVCENCFLLLEQAPSRPPDPQQNVFSFSIVRSIRIRDDLGAAPVWHPKPAIAHRIVAEFTDRGSMRVMSF